MDMEQINEKSLSRVYAHILNHDCAIITAFRAQMINCLNGDDSDEKVNTFQNKERNRELASALMLLGYDITKVKGTYIENYLQDNSVEVKEDSWFVVNTKDDSNFISTIIKLGEMYCQDSVVILERGGKNSYLVGTNNSDFPGYGEKEIFGTLKFGNQYQFMTKVGNRPFVMESFETSQINSKRIILKYGKPIVEMLKIK
jgi:hypothetical protein